MATKTIYSCDWCGVESPHINNTPCEWETHQVPKMSKAELLCGGCNMLRTKAIADARQRVVRASAAEPR